MPFIPVKRLAQAAVQIDFAVVIHPQIEAHRIPFHRLAARCGWNCDHGAKPDLGVFSGPEKAGRDIRPTAVIEVRLLRARNIRLVKPPVLQRHAKQLHQFRLQLV